MISSDLGESKNGGKTSNKTIVPTYQTGNINEVLQMHQVSFKKLHRIDRTVKRLSSENILSWLVQHFEYYSYAHERES